MFKKFCSLLLFTWYIVLGFCLTAISLREALKRKIGLKFGEKNVSEDWEKKAKFGILKLIDFLKGELLLDSDMFIKAKNTFPCAHFK